MKIRKALATDTKAIARVHVDSWKTTYRNIVPDSYLEGLTYKAREQLWNEKLKKCTAFVAETENGEVIGFADCGNERSGDYPGIEGEVLFHLYTRSLPRAKHR